jgi:hypothetical protein
MSSARWQYVVYQKAAIDSQALRIGQRIKGLTH